MFFIHTTRLRRWLARQAASIFHRFCDPSLEYELAAPEIFAEVQANRRRHVEMAIAKYIGPCR